jgi:hypothetical protein
MFATYSFTHSNDWWNDQMASGAGLVVLCVALFLWLVTVMAMWKTYQKAGVPGWGALIPIYNLYLLLKIVGRPGWWLLLYLIPLVNIVIALVVYIDVAHAFTKSTAFGVLTFFFPFIGYWILGYGDAVYKAPVR